MSFQVIQPSPGLSPYVRMYWAMESNLKPGEQHIQRIVPNGLAEIIFYQNDVPDSSLKEGFLKSQTQISGQKNCHYDLIVSGKTKLFSILFNPQGISRFFNVPASELFNQTIPLRFILGKQLNEIEDKLFEADAPLIQAEVIEKLLYKLLLKKDSKLLPGISQSLHVINHHESETEVQLLASEACLSRKQFERNFTELIGITPKQFMRVVRFQRALFLQQNNDATTLTQLGFNSGYYDQSHMISEFKMLTGFTPKQYFAHCEPFSDYFSKI